MLEKNQICSAEITGITSEGSGVCRINGMAVFVPETAVGDKLEIRIVKVLKNYAYGIIEHISEPSPDRTDFLCPQYKKCGGCVFRHLTYEAECKVKDNIVSDAFRRIGGLDIETDTFISADTTERYRNKAQYPLAVQDGRAVCGFYAPRSHRLVPVTDCALQPEVFGDILRTVLGYINEKKLTVYDEATGSGIMRHIYLRRGAHSGEIMVCLVARKDVSRQLAPLSRELTESFPDIKNVVLNINPTRTNVILGERCVTLLGSDTITDVMCGNEVEISPLSFYQADLIFQFGEELDGFLIAAADLLHDLLDGTDNEDTVLLILPAILQGNRDPVKQESVKDLGLRGHRPVCLVLKEDLRNTDKRKLFAFRAVEIVIHAYHHPLL